VRTRDVGPECPSPTALPQRRSRRRPRCRDPRR
jgi:hypothetical protein